jgi:C4-type Zn-finger protein
MYKKDDLAQVDARRFVYKNPKTNFYCPLCRTKRSFLTSPRLSKMNWLQMVLITVVLSACLYPIAQLKSVFVFFVVWALFEGAVRVVFRKEIPCPHCGFDASWYKKDVKIARRIVEDFWDDKKTLQTSEMATETTSVENNEAEFMPPPQSSQIDENAYFS